MYDDDVWQFTSPDIQLLFQCLYLIEGVLYCYGLWLNNQFSTIALEDQNAISKLSF